MNSRLIHWGKSVLNHRWSVPILLLVLFMALLAPRFVGGRTLVPMDVLNGIDPWSNYFPARADNPNLGDAATQHYEWVVDFHRRIHSGDMPAWQPLIAGGVPYSPNGSIAVHYPPTWIYAVFPPDVGFALFMVLHFWLASLGVWLLLRAMGVGNPGAVFGGVAYAMSGLVRNWSFGPLNLPSLALAPLLLYGVERCVSRPSVKSALVLSMTTALMLVGGNPQFTFQMMIGAFVFGVVRMVTGGREWRPRLAALGTSACGVLLGFVLAAAEIAPFLVISENVLRAGESLADIKITVAPLSGLTRLAMPNFFQNPIAGSGWSNNPEVWMDSPYVGLLAAALAAAALVHWRDRRIWVLGAVAVVGLLFAYLPSSHDLPYRLVPIWDRFRGALRWLSVANLGLALLAGIGLDLLGRALPKRRLQGWLTAAALIGLAALPFAYIVVRRLAIPSDHLRAEVMSLGVVLAISAVALFMATTKGLAWALLALIPELIFHFLPHFPINPRDQLKSYETIPEMQALARFDDGRVARLQEVVTPLPPLIPNVPMLIGRADTGGFTVLMPSHYIEFLNLIQNHGDFAKHTNEVPSFVPGEALNSPLINLANIRYLISRPEVASPSGWKRFTAGTLVLYENPVAHPEAWIASRKVAGSLRERWLDPGAR